MKKTFAALAALILCVLGALAGCSSEPKPVDDSWKQAYSDLFAQNLVLSRYASPSIKAYQLKYDTITDAPADLEKNAYWITGFALCDLNLDGVPELLLNSGEVETEAYVFTARDGKVFYLNFFLSGNQEYTDAAALYQNKKTGDKAWYSESLSGSGAGSYYEFALINADASLQVLRSYTTDYDESKHTYVPAYRLNGADAAEDAFEQAAQSFAAEYTQLAICPLTAFDANDPAAMLASAIEAYTPAE